MLDVGGSIQSRVELPLAGSTGPAAIDQVASRIESLLALLTVPPLGIDVGSPGIVDLAGVVVSAPNLEWVRVPLQAPLFERFGAPVVVANDANAAVLAEQRFGGVEVDLMLVRVGRRVGATLLLRGILLHGSRFTPREIGSLAVGTDEGELCGCGTLGCLETWLAAPRLEAKLEDTAQDATLAAARDNILRDAAIMVTPSRLGDS